MESSEIIPALIFIFFVFVLPAIFVIELLKLLFRDDYILRKEKSLIRYYNTFPNRIDKSTHELLLVKFPYYSNLKSNDKIKFYVRLTMFMASKNFKPCLIPEVTYEMKALISASAMQLTFGLEKFIFHHFKTIMVYPKAFHSKYDRNYHKGDVNIKGAITLSYEDFIDGYRDSVDAYNLGLHEMAHALELELNLKDEYDAFFAAYYERWLKSATTELIRMNYGQSEVLRKYASRNIKEFFSVCVENFFERPVNMKERLPEIYRHLRLMLNQDPVSAYMPGDVRNNIPDIAEEPNEPHLLCINVSLSKRFGPIILLGIFLIILAIMTKEIIVFLIFLVFIAFIISLILINSNSLILYKEVLLIKPLFSQIFRTKAYRLEILVSVTLFPGRKSVFKVSHIIHGKIENTKHSVYFSNVQTAELIAKLKALKIMVKHR